MLRTSSYCTLYLSDCHFSFNASIGGSVIRINLATRNYGLQAGLFFFLCGGGRDRWKVSTVILRPGR